MEYENALNFLLYSYFGIDGGVRQLEEKRDTITNLCAHRAYLDLARTVKFKYSTSELEDMNASKSTEEEKEEAEEYQKAKKDCIDSICRDILIAVDEDKIHCCDAEFTKWHEKKCDEIKFQMNQATYTTIFPGNNRIIRENFTYGQAQKWLNMTLKYLWLLDLLPDGLTKDSLHVPIDSYIIEAVKSKDKTQYGLGIENDLSKISWSAWDNYYEYTKYQADIKEEIKNLSPIEWEGKAWIEIAKKHA